MLKPALNRWKKAWQIYSMKHIFFYIILLLAGCFGFTQPIFPQNRDVDFVKSVNPTSPNSFVFKGLSASVYPAGIALPVGTCIIGEIKKDKKIRILSYEEAGAVVIGAVVAEGLKKAIDRKRPYEKYTDIYPYRFEKGQSFPSGHTTIAFATATILTLQYKKWYVAVPAYAWAAGSGFSRLYLGEHFTTDVLAGAGIGTGSALISYWLTKKIFK